MHLHEYQTKQLFAHYGILIPIGYICSTPYEAEEAISKIGHGPWVIKCQVHASGRGKAGAIKVTNNKKDVRNFAEAWLGQRLVTYQTNVLGQPVNKILVEAAVHINKELYLGAVVDCSSKRIVFMGSTKGGVNVEQVAQGSPEFIYKIVIDPLISKQPYQGRELAFKLGLSGKQVGQFTAIFMGLVTLFLERDLVMVEVNPLVVTTQGDLVCLDGKLTADDNALFRQPELRKMRDLSQENECEFSASQWKIKYVALDGNIGCMVNGAGLAMGTMDVIRLYGGKPANFLDIGGGATKERITEAFKIILSDNKVKVVLVNIFGGIVRCDLVANGIINAVADVSLNIPVVVRLEGNHAKLGIKKLAESNFKIITTTSLTHAAWQVMALVGRQSCQF